MEPEITICWTFGLFLITYVLKLLIIVIMLVLELYLTEAIPLCDNITKHITHITIVHTMGSHTVRTLTALNLYMLA